MAERREKLVAIRADAKAAGVAAFPNDFKPQHQAQGLADAFGEKTKEELEPLAVRASVAGRMMLKRVMGKASFASLQDASMGSAGGRIQIYLNNDSVGEDLHQALKHWVLRRACGTHAGHQRGATNGPHLIDARARCQRPKRPTICIRWLSPQGGGAVGPYSAIGVAGFKNPGNSNLHRGALPQRRTPANHARDLAAHH